MPPPAPLERDAPIAVVGLGLIGPLGVGVEATLDALLRGASGIAPVEGLHRGRRRLAAAAARFDAGAYADPRALRRMPRVAQLAVAAAGDAQAAAGGAGPDPDRVGVALGTGFGALGDGTTFLAQVLERGAGAANPALFPQSVPNAAAAFVAMALGLRGPGATAQHGDLSALAALELACDALRLGRADRMLAGGAEELSPALAHGYGALGLLAPRSPRGEEVARPLDRRRDGVVLGEGAALLALERVADARARGARIWALLHPQGAAGDPRRPQGWDGGVSGALAAARAALDHAGLRPAQVGGVALSADGSPARDRLEAACYRALFGGAGPPAWSIAGAVGASPATPALALAVAVAALGRGIAPPTVGYREPDPAAQVEGLSSGRPTTLRGPSLLVWSLAPGGAARALVAAVS